MTKVPEYTLASGNGTETLEFRGLSITRVWVDRTQVSVVATVNGEEKYRGARSAQHVNAAWALLGKLLQLKKKRAKLMTQKQETAKRKGDMAKILESLKILDDEYALAVRVALRDNVPAEWLVKVATVKAAA